jgi:hypothetical protein
MGSDLAHRPSENAPTNCDSSESEKSNDSPRMRGVWKSGSNWREGKESADEVHECRRQKPEESQEGRRFKQTESGLEARPAGIQKRNRRV